MKRKTEVKQQGPAETADEGNVRLGDGVIYFDPAADTKRSGPAETADDGRVKLGNGLIYFDPLRDR